MDKTGIVKKNSEFAYIYRQGKSYANKLLVMYIIENNGFNNRIGISVSKKVGNSVTRHRVKRLIKESYRLSNENFIKGYDIVIVARVNAKDKSFKEIESALLHLCKMQKILIDWLR